jgi:hypothetical protein
VAITKASAAYLENLTTYKMSDLLNQASLVMVPSGYKEDVVYSQIPTDGSGDMAFTRASNGTRVNSAGLVEVVAWNLVEQSETIGVSPWVSANVTITTNATTAPNGTSTAEKITENTSNGYHQVYQEIFASGSVVGQDYTFSCYAKASERTKISLALQTPSVSVATFDLINGTASITDGSGTAGVAIQSVGNGWYRCSIYRLNTTTGYIYGNLQMNNGTVTVYTGDGTSGVFVYGAQLNIGATTKPYFPTTDRLNVPRLTYQNGGGGCPSLLLEKQSTNELSYSEQFDNADWSVKDNLSVTANATTSPDGTQNADKLVEDSSNSNHRVYRAIDGTSKMFSFFAKPSGRSWVLVLCNNGNTWFDIGNGQLGTVASTSTATIENVGNGWYRCAVYNTHASFGALIGLTTGNNVTSYQGDGTSGAFVWGAQMEASSYPTSYIPTTSSSATRVADVCTKTGIGALIGGTSGTVFFDIKTNPVLTSANYKQFFYYTNSSANQGYMYLNSGNGIITNPPFGNLSSSITLSPNTRYKIALTYANNDFALYVNGVSVATASSGTPLNFENLLSLGNYQGASEFNEFVFNQYTHFKSRLTNAELASLTTI